MSATEVVLYDETPSGVATITINRPKSMNSLSGEVFTKLNEIAKKLRYSKTAKVVVLTGAGNRAFSAGNDVKGGSFTAGAEYDPRPISGAIPSPASRWSAARSSISTRTTWASRS